MNLIIYHELYTGQEYQLCLDNAFKNYLNKKLEKFKEKYNKDYLIYSIGIDQDNGTMAISVVHPFDDFKNKVATDIVTGRIKRMNGDIPNRLPYNPIPDYIEVEE